MIFLDIESGNHTFCEIPKEISSKNFRHFAERNKSARWSVLHEVIKDPKLEEHWILYHC
jgi:hypothetical protein